jgi:hypothetical protein
MKNLKYSITVGILILSFILSISLAYSGGPQKLLTPQSGANPTISPVKPLTPSQPAVPQASQPFMPSGPIIQITSPEVNEQVLINSKYKIQWINIGQMSQFVNIALVRGDAKFEIANNMPNSGFYEWVPSPDKLGPGKFQLRITTSDNKIQSDSAIFQLVNPYIKISKIIGSGTDTCRFNFPPIIDGSGLHSYPPTETCTILWDRFGDTGSSIKVDMRMVSDPSKNSLLIPNASTYSAPNNGQVVLHIYPINTTCHGDTLAPSGIDFQCPDYDPNNEYIIKIQTSGAGQFVGKDERKIRILRPGLPAI